MKPICVPCERFMRPKKTGFRFIEGMPSHNGAKPGKAEPEAWKPYKLWNGDLWACPDCGAEIIAGCAAEPLAEHYETHFSEAVTRSGATLLVKDC